MIRVTVSRYERLDRLEIVQAGHFTRSKTVQAKARRHLMKLYEASYGLHLGNSAVDQQKFLSQDPAQRAEVEVTCELWFSDAIQVAKLNHKALKFAEYPITLATITKRLQSLEIGAPGTSR